MNTLKISLSLSLLTFLSLGMAPAQAGVMSCSAPAPTTYGLGNATSAECFTGNDTNQIDNAFVLFGSAGWILSEKNDGPDGDGTIEFLSAPVNGDKSGSWSIDTLAGLTDIAITLKAGNGFGAFLLDLSVPNPLVGTWSSGKDLSHSSIYYKGTPTTDVPEPASIALLLFGLLGLGVAKRYRS